MRNSVTVTVPVQTVSEMNQRSGRRGHGGWRERYARTKLQRSSTTLVLNCARPLPELPVTITLTRVAPRCLDGDNCQAALKAVRDGVADAYKIDDGDSRFTWQYRQVTGGVRVYAVEIEIARRTD